MIEYKGRPLFGEGSSVSHTSEFFAIAGTVLFWLIFLIFSFVIKPQPKKKYKEVQIVLSSTPVVQKSQDASAPAEAASASVASEQSETPSEASVVKASAQKSEPVQKPAESSKPKAQTQPKKEPAKTQAQPKAAPKPAPAPQKTVSEPIEYAVDPMEAFAAQTKQQPKKEVDWDAMFADDEPEEQNNQNNPQKVETKNSISPDIAGSSADNSQDQIYSKTSNELNNQDVSDNTKNRLSDIQKSGKNDYSESGESQTNFEKFTDSGTMKWTKGTGRRLKNALDKNLASINEMRGQLSKETPFTISFSVDSNGHVIRSSIQISNTAMLTSNVKNEMIDHICMLAFTSGEGTASAEFIWKLSPQ